MTRARDLRRAGELEAVHQSPQFRREWNAPDRLTQGIDPHLYEVAEVLDAHAKH